MLAHYDKPHRCPTCWAIPDKAQHHGRAKFGHIYRCGGCPTWWIMLKPRWWSRLARLYRTHKPR